MFSPIIVALDFSDIDKCSRFINIIDPKICALKVGLELFTKAGPSFITKLVNQGFRVFLDLKFHDIPNTVAKACKVAADLGVWMINVHALGGHEMLSAAKQAITETGHATLLVGVTVLTSSDALTLRSININKSVDEQVMHLAKICYDNDLDGIVCSALEAQSIKANFGNNFITVTPGIRLSDDNLHDQKRIMTPKNAIDNGSDYLVIGRSITESPEPSKKISEILESLRYI